MCVGIVVVADHAVLINVDRTGVTINFGTLLAKHCCVAGVERRRQAKWYCFGSNA